MLLKLGVSLIGLDQRDVACATFKEIGKRYPEIVRRAEATRQAGTGAGRVLSAAVAASTRDAIFGQFDLVARGAVVAAVSGGSDSTGAAVPAQGSSRPRLRRRRGWSP